MFSHFHVYSCIACSLIDSIRTLVIFLWHPIDSQFKSYHILPFSCLFMYSIVHLVWVGNGQFRVLPLGYCVPVTSPTAQISLFLLILLLIILSTLLLFLAAAFLLSCTSYLPIGQGVAKPPIAMVVDRECLLVHLLLLEQINHSGTTMNWFEWAWVCEPPSQWSTSLWSWWQVLLY